MGGSDGRGLDQAIVSRVENEDSRGALVADDVRDEAEKKSLKIKQTKKTWSKENRAKHLAKIRRTKVDKLFDDLGDQPVPKTSSSSEVFARGVGYGIKVDLPSLHLPPSLASTSLFLVTLSTP